MEVVGGCVVGACVVVVGQTCVLHGLLCERSPTQSAPNPSLVGLSHARVRVDVPEPHGLVQLPHTVHEESPPFRSCKLKKSSLFQPKYFLNNFFHTWLSYVL